jgi:hypothetical protein
MTAAEAADEYYSLPNDKTYYIISVYDPTWSGLTISTVFITLTISIDAGAEAGEYPITVQGIDQDECVPSAVLSGFITDDWENVAQNPTFVNGSITVTGNSNGDNDPSDGAIDKGATYGGTITPAAPEGQYTVTVTDATNWVIDEVWVDGVKLPAATVQGRTSYTTTTAPERSIFASFAYTVNFQSPLNGYALSVKRGAETLTRGDIVRPGDVLVISCGEGNKFTALTVNGVNVLTLLSPDGSYSYTVGTLGDTRALEGGLTVTTQGAVIVWTAEAEASGPPPTIYAVNIGALENGSVTASPASAATGAAVTLTVTPANGYRLKEGTLKVNNGAVSLNGNAFTMPDESVTVTSEFEPIPEPTWNGKGTAAEPYLIANAADLSALAESVNGGKNYAGEYFEQTADIDLSAIASWTPIGTDTNAFRGNYDGGGKEIAGLTITADTEPSGRVSLGLFGFSSGAAFENITVRGRIDVTYTPADETGITSAKHYIIGGITGRLVYDNGSIANCVSYVDITFPGAEAGGIVGVIGYATISDCLNYGSITGSKSSTLSVGGIAGSVSSCSVIRSGNYGTIYAPGHEQQNTNIGGSAPIVEYVGGSTGGIAGSMSSSSDRIVNCFNKGDVTSWSTATGGIVGGVLLNPYNGSTLTVSDCYNTGNIVGASKNNANTANSETVGGIVGGGAGGYSQKDLESVTRRMSLVVTNCYNTGAISSLGVARTYTDELVGDINAGGAAEYTITKDNAPETVRLIDISNSYRHDDEFTAHTLGASFKDDDNGVNGGMPLLAWEVSEVGDETYAVTFAATPQGAVVAVYSDSARTQLIQSENIGGYALRAGTYYYTVSANGHITENGSFSLTSSARTVTVTLKEAAVVTFTLSPPDLTLTVLDNTGKTVAPDGGTGGRYTLIKGSGYTYNASAPGYNGTTREFTAVSGETHAIKLTASDHPGSGGAGGENSDKLIYGSGNAGETSEITAGGTYYLAKGATGFLKIDTTSPVTLVGTGIGQSDMYTEIYIQCLRPGTKLTLRDVYISNEHSGHGGSNMIDFTGKDNYLYFSGTSILDQNSNASGFAMIHVNSSTELTVGGVTPSDTLYFYKREQGAGIGGNGDASGSEGQAPEYNGAITITGGNLFMKNSKQGALIGSGANANSTSYTPGPITIEGGVLNLVAISRGAAIGGSAGSSGGARGSNVVINGGTISITIDYSGAAIGGGGYDKGNDSPGGTLRYNGGSIRTFLTRNAAEGDGESLWPVTQPGVNDIVITADKTNGSGQPVYLLKLDTSKLKQSARSFTVSDGNTSLYSGGLHEYAYINEDLQKLSQVDINYTVDNWIPLNDANLYLYLTGADHTLTVNSEKLAVKWNAASKTFDVTYASGETVSPGTTPDNETAAPSTTKIEGDDATTIVDEPIPLAENPTLVVINVETGGTTVNNITAEVTAENVKAIAENGSAIEVRSDLGNVTLPNEAVKSLSGSAEKKVDVKLTKNSADTYTLALTADDKAVATVDGGVKLTIPSEDTTPGTVAVIVHADGTEEVIKKSVGKDGKVSIPLDGSATIKIVDNSKAFADVAIDAWYSDGVKFTSSHELFQGTDNGGFAPEMSMTRGMLATVLHRLENAPSATGELFADVNGDAYYAEAIIWASANSIVNGTGSGFAPDAEINREQLAVMLYRYYAWFTVGDGVPDVPSTDLDRFPDADNVSDWASDAVIWAVGIGLINGRDSGLAPKGTATRAEVAVILERFIENIL